MFLLNFITSGYSKLVSLQSQLIFPKIFTNVPIIIFLFCISLVPRVYDLQSTEIYPDEITWTVRSREAFLALKTKNLDYFKTAWWNDEKETQAVNLPTAVLSGASIFFLAKNQPTHYSLNILPDYIAARIPLVFINSVFIVIFYLVMDKITKSKKVAFLGSLMLSLDPVYLALSRWLLADSFLMVWVFLSMSSYFFVKKYFLSILLSSFFLSLAFLTKPTALLAFVVFLLYSPKKFILVLTVFTIFTHIFWLGSQNPLGWEIVEYTLKQARLAQIPIATFFQGKVTTNPPMYYYFYELFIRLPVLTLTGLVIATFYIKPILKLLSNKEAICILVFVFLYILSMSLSTEKLGIRYIFPIYPWIYLLSSLGIVFFLNQQKKATRYILLTLSFITPIALSYYYFPNYYLYYNLLSGGPAHAQKNTLVGLCMGAKGSIAFIEENYNAGRVAYLGCNKTVIPYYSPVTVTTDWKAEKFVVIEESFRTLSPENQAVEYYKTKNPIFINQQKGAILSRVYLNE